METRQSAKKGFYYGWVILGVGFFVFLNYGVFYSYGVYFKPLIAEFGWSRAETSFAFTLYQITYSFAAIPMGLLFDKYGPKVPLLLCALSLGGGIALISQINSLWQLWLLFGIVAAFGHGATHLVPLATAVKWFLDRRGLAVGLVNSGSGVGLLLIPTLVGALIVALGDWRPTLLILGAAFFSLNVVAAMFMRRPPWDKPGSSHPAASAAARPGEGRDFTLGQALRTRAYWMFYVGDSLSFSAYTMLVVHMVPFTTDMGIATTQATLTVALMGLGAVIGRITGGALSDRFGWQVTMASFFFLQALAILNLLWVKDLWALYPLSLALGFFNAGGMINSSPALTRLFGLANLGKLLGVSATTGAVAGLMGATVAGLLFDALKSYQWPFIYASVISAMGATSIALIKARHSARASS